VKIADFGFARKISSEDSLLTLCGTPMYIAPEILSGAPYGTKVDMWSLGVLAYILSTGKFPFNSLNNDELCYDSMRGRFKINTSSWKAVSLGAKDVVTSLLVVTPSARLSAKQVIRLPWFVESDRPLLSSTNNMKFKSKIATQKLRCAVFTVSALFRGIYLVMMLSFLTLSFLIFFSRPSLRIHSYP
jgi:serine/threonine protein kinase